MLISFILMPKAIDDGLSLRSATFRVVVTCTRTFGAAEWRGRGARVYRTVIDDHALLQHRHAKRKHNT
eukprot:m.72920 g.72920  ORF g.72920 m.72920 type:complete len:68 (-) comp8807_c0_seq2:519-722(-)